MRSQSALLVADAEATDIKGLGAFPVFSFYAMDFQLSTPPFLMASSGSDELSHHFQKTLWPIVHNSMTSVFEPFEAH